MHHYVYKTTNLIDGKIYIGKHSTRNIDDGYMGSGLMLRRAIEKYGIENFSKEILRTFESSKDAFDYEQSIVTEKFLKEENTYNIKIGGNGGFDHINNENKQLYNEKMLKTISGWSEEKRKEINKLKARPGEKNGMFDVHRCGSDSPMYGKSLSEETKQIISDMHKNKIVMKDAETGEIIGFFDKDNENYKSGKWVSVNLGKKRTEEQKKLLSKIRKDQGIIPPNPKGKLWWNDGHENIRAETCPGESFERGRLKWRDIQNHINTNQKI